MNRLYVVVRRDIDPGAQAAQSCHAVSEFAVRFPEEHRQWHQHGQNIVLVSVRALAELTDLAQQIKNSGIHVAEFYEPDFGGELTAFAVSDRAQKLLSNLPLTLRAPKQAA